jgi:uncharacterized protein YuzE
VWLELWSAAMRATYDQKADARYVRFSNSEIIESEEVRPGSIIDYDAEERIVSILMLDARNQLSADALAEIKTA